MQIVDWTGEDVFMDGDVLRKLGAEASINRRYSRSSGLESISLFIIAKGVTLNLVGDAPEICNVVNGYTLMDQRFVELPLGNGMKLPCTILQFSRSGSLDEEKKTVLYYYMANSEFCSSRSVLRSRVRRGNSIVRCVGQVQIAASAAGALTADSATQLVCDFAADSAVAISELFKQIEEDQSVNSLRILQEGGSR